LDKIKIKINLSKELINLLKKSKPDDLTLMEYIRRILKNEANSRIDDL